MLRLRDIPIEKRLLHMSLRHGSRSSLRKQPTAMGHPVTQMVAGDTADVVPDALSECLTLLHPRVCTGQATTKLLHHMPLGVSTPIPSDSTALSCSNVLGRREWPAGREGNQDVWPNTERCLWSGCGLLRRRTEQAWDRWGRIRHLAETRGFRILIPNPLPPPPPTSADAHSSADACLSLQKVQGREANRRRHRLIEPTTKAWCQIPPPSPPDPQSFRRRLSPM